MLAVLVISKVFNCPVRIENRVGRTKERDKRVPNHDLPKGPSFLLRAHCNMIFINMIVHRGQDDPQGYLVFRLLARGRLSVGSSQSQLVSISPSSTRGRHH